MVSFTRQDRRANHIELTSSVGGRPGRMQRSPDEGQALEPLLFEFWGFLQSLCSLPGIFKGVVHAPILSSAALAGKMS